MSNLSILKKSLPNMTSMFTLSYVWLNLVSLTLEYQMNGLFVFAYSFLLLTSLYHVEFTKACLAFIFIKDSMICTREIKIINFSLGYYFLISTYVKCIIQFLILSEKEKRKIRL
jgi:hypothetical protein